LNNKDLTINVEQLHNQLGSSVFYADIGINIHE